MTADILRAHTRKQLETMARRDRVAGWHDMNKEELVRALLKKFHSRGRGDTDHAPALPTARPTAARRNGTVARNHKSAADEPERRPALIAERQPPMQDSLSAMAMDAHWVHATWTLSAATLERARAALTSQWRSSVPVLRIYDVTSDDDAGGSRTRSGDVTVSIEEGHWFVRVGKPGRKWLLELGFRSATGQFHRLVHSQPVTLPTDRRDRRSDSARPAAHATPAARSSAENLVPKSVSAARRAADAAETAATQSGDWRLRLQTELQISGQTHPLAEVRAAHEKVPLSADGRFTLRLPLENGRVVVPADVISPDGSEQRTVIVAVELNVREMEPQVFDETAE